MSWLENPSVNYIQNITVCQRLTNGGLTGTGLPFWSLNVYPNSKSEADAIASPTIKDQSFQIQFPLKGNAPEQFTIYFEIDRSNEYNDWFVDKRSTGAPNYVQDQPAILYKADIDLSNTSISEYELIFHAWTPNEYTEEIITPMPFGIPQTETRYITHLKNGSGFGAEDNEHRIDRMVESIHLRVK